VGNSVIKSPLAPSSKLTPRQIGVFTGLC
jgi:hypothetical protein